ncbi:multidrug efflux system outer membrane protein [Algoriphagus boseongensis]|uniref:Multidrug efflux system outer membrane protein n=1 Tax=Algoriphagus boseongensis TaxID=1442587 RepID=A0A4R6T5J6_9BACT|nr:efflux transporter outer membrane subunit [Algoriphagus boseongensis]TDQ17264.1 multidrug efflux system outer membrane protein [Algoriphagus boseongensis]
MKKLSLILFLGLTLAACKSGANYQGITVPVTDRFQYQDTTYTPVATVVKVDTLKLDSALNLNWFDLYQDPALDSLIAKALTKNQDLLIASEAIQQAQSALIVQKSQMLPSLGYSAGASRGNFAFNNSIPTSSLFTGFGSVNWELDFWGKYRRLNEAARASILASEEGYRATKLSLVTTVASAYFQLTEYQLRLEISKQTLNLRDSMETIIKARFDKGIIAEIDLNQAQIQTAIAAGSIPIWERLIVQTENLLSVLTGEIPGKIETGTPLKEQSLDISLPEILPVQLLSRRPDVLAAEQAVIAQNAITGSAKANRLPNISLSGLIGVAGTQFSALGGNGASWNIGASLLGPIFNWGALQRQVDIEESRTRQSILSYEKTVLQAYQEVENTLATIASLKKELIARENHVRAAVKAQYLSQERYNQGVTSYLEYLESQRQAFDAQLNFAGTKQELLSSYAVLYKALGGGW